MKVMELERGKTYTLRDLLFEGAKQGETEERCDWTCPNVIVPSEQFRCHGVYEHKGEHQCPVCFIGKNEEQQIADYIARKLKD